MVTTSATRDPNLDMTVERDPATLKLVKDVFHETWDEYYKWEHEYCLQTLRSLACDSESSLAQPQRRTTKPTGSSKPKRPPPLPPSSSSGVPKTSTLPSHVEFFTITDYPEPPTLPPTPTVTTLLSNPLSLLPASVPSPCPQYEICTPLNRSIAVGDDSEYMPFIPLADDPTFDMFRHSQDYKYFEWEVGGRGPDDEAIALRTVHKLHHQHQLSFSTIQEHVSNMFSVPINSLLAVSRRQDPLPWPPLQPSLPYTPPHSTSTPKTILQSLVSDFCANANCVIGYCTVHMGEMSLPPPVPPTLPSAALAHSIDAPCGPACFLLGTPNVVGTFWSPTDLELLQTVLDYSPDMVPCEVAVIVRKPCHEVYKHRVRTFPDASIPLKLVERDRGKVVRGAALQFLDHDAALFTPNWPCTHPGPCDARSPDCACFKNGAHCERSCRCDRKCIRRWRGCTCTKSRLKMPNTCGTARCPCYRAHRECDPEVCVRCEARYPDVDLCRNAYIQRDGRKRTEVKQSTWGLGLFLMEDVREEDFVIEYTGELLYEVTTICRDFVSKQRGRNYVFQLNPTVSIDSTTAGNESRFINHDPVKANCHASVRLVNGEHRIGIFTLTNISAGTELLLNYGDSFFQHPSSSEAEGGDPDPNPNPNAKKPKIKSKAKSKSQTQTKGPPPPPPLTGEPPVAAKEQDGDGEGEGGQEEEQDDRLGSLPPVLYTLDQHSSDETYSDSGVLADPESDQE